MGGAWQGDLNCRLRCREMVARGRGVRMSCLRRAAAAAVARCFMVARAAVRRWADISGCEVVAR
eukprot:6081211-Alexandrium_andersonii.AAC.1